MSYCAGFVLHRSSELVCSVLGVLDRMAYDYERDTVKGTPVRPSVSMTLDYLD